MKTREALKLITPITFLGFSIQTFSKFKTVTI